MRARGWGRTHILQELEKRYGKGVVSAGTIGSWLRDLRKPVGKVFEPEPWWPWEAELEP